jgi:putative membrane protein
VPNPSSVAAGKAGVGGLPRDHAIALILFGVVLAATWWHPIWPAEQALHHSLTLVALGVLVWAQRRWPLPLTSFVLILAFLALHTIAARWIYSFVPYDEWTRALFGRGLNDVLGWRRNNFDRLVHLAYGLCLAPVLMRLLVDRRSWRPGWAALAAVDVVISTGAVYELFEWGVAVTLAPDLAEAYNGQQGDVWDPQKDMATAAAGAIVAVMVAVLFTRRAAGRGERR